MNTIQQTFETLVRECLNSLEHYKAFENDSDWPWSITDMANGVRAIIDNRNLAHEDGYNPFLDEDLRNITNGVDDYRDGDGNYYLFKVLCDEILDKMIEQ